MVHKNDIMAMEDILNYSIIRDREEGEFEQSKTKALMSAMIGKNVL